MACLRHTQSVSRRHRVCGLVHRVASSLQFQGNFESVACYIVLRLRYVAVCFGETLSLWPVTPCCVFVMLGFVSGQL